MLTQMILIVEPDPVLRMGMAVDLRDLGNVEVMIAGTLENSRKLIGHHRPDLTISELHLPDGMALELLTHLHREGTDTQILFMSNHIQRYEKQIPKSPDVGILRKPFEVENLRRIVRERLGLPTLLQHTQPFTLDEYLQIATIGKHSVLLEISNQQGQAASCVLWKGEVYAAQDRSGAGDEAFARICYSWLRDRPKLSCTTLTIPPDRNVTQSDWQRVFFEAAAAFDEGSARRGAFSLVPPPPHLPPVIGEQPQCVLFDEHVERGIDMVLAANYAEAVVAFRAALRIRADAGVQVKLKRLAELGFG